MDQAKGQLQKTVTNVAAGWPLPLAAAAETHRPGSSQTQFQRKGIPTAGRHGGSMWQTGPNERRSRPHHMVN